MSNLAATLNVNNPIARWAHNPGQYLDQGWYDLSPKRGRWYFRRRDPVVVLDENMAHPMLCHVNVITRTGWLVVENKFNGQGYPSIRPNDDRVYPVDLFHPLFAKFADLV